MPVAIPFTADDVTRLADLLNDEAWYLICQDVDKRGAAVDMLHRWTDDGHPASTLSPLRFRGAYGTRELQDVITDNLLDPEEGDVLPEVPGDVYSTDDGLTVVTPAGPWVINYEQAIKLNSALGAMLAFTLTQPWSADDPSTILSRGRRPVAEEG